jgi:hypothetical protein
MKPAAGLMGWNDLSIGEIVGMPYLHSLYKDLFKAICATILLYM